MVHDWVKAASGQYAEERVFSMLEKRFSNQSCLLVNGFTEKDLVKVIKENIIEEKKLLQQNQKQNQTNKTALESNFTQMELGFYKLTNRHYSDLAEQIKKMIDPTIEQIFSQENVPQLLQQFRTHKPGYDLLSESNKKNYMKNIEDLMKKKFKDGGFHTKSQLKDFILEHFLIKTDQNSEYDLLLFLKVRFFFIPHLSVNVDMRFGHMLDSP